MHSRTLGSGIVLSTMALLLAACLSPAVTITPSPATATPTTLPATPTASAVRCNFPRLGPNAPGRIRAYYDKTHELLDAGFWQFSTPEEQGLSSEILKEGVDHLSENATVYSLLILRNDVIVVERYFHTGRINRAANIQSVSKSILSALVGIAIREGYIKSLDQKVAEFLPEYFADVDDPRKKEITLRDLLTMRSGFAWEDNITGLPGDDWVQAALAFPLAYPPGRKFNYSTISSHLMSVVLTRASGMSTCEFAYRYLFDPLGITVENWYLDPQGYALGGSGMFITAREMAKFGLLYLHGGEWAGVQVLPAEWVSESQGSRVVVSAPGNVRYGYYWWQHSVGGYRVHSALGYGGQNICIIPSLNIVLVTTADSASIGEEIDISYFLERYVIPAVSSGK